VRLLSQRDLGAKAWPFTGDMRRIRLRLGAFEFLLTRSEAVDLATQLADAVAASRATPPAEPQAKPGDDDG
jgi:hypothetical protein